MRFLQECIKIERKSGPGSDLQGSPIFRCQEEKENPEKLWESSFQANEVLQERGDGQLLYAAEGLSEMRAGLTVGIVNIATIDDLEKKRFSGVMGGAPYFME